MDDNVECCQRMPLINDDAPSFRANTTQGEIHFPADYKGKWVILFSHPADFTPVCTTEFMTFASMIDDFKACGGFLLIATGCRIAKIQDFPVADMIPAMVLVMPLSALWVNWVIPML